LIAKPRIVFVKQPRGRSQADGRPRPARMWGVWCQALKSGEGNDGRWGKCNWPQRNGHAAGHDRSFNLALKKFIGKGHPSAHSLESSPPLFFFFFLVSFSKDWPLST